MPRRKTSSQKLVARSQWTKRKKRATGRKLLTTDYRLLSGNIFEFFSVTRRRVGLGLIAVGLVIFFSLGVYRVTYGQDLSFAVERVSEAPAVVESAVVGTLPKQIVIEKVGIDLPIFAGSIVKGKWTVVANGANHWNESAKLGEKGNVVIYGHNWGNLFGPIRQLEVGDTIRVRGENDQLFNYTVIQTMSVKPTQVEIVAPTKEPQLTLYTCIGFLDRERFVVIAKPTIATSH